MLPMTLQANINNPSQDGVDGSDGGGVSGSGSVSVGGEVGVIGGGKVGVSGSFGVIGSGGKVGGGHSSSSGGSVSENTKGLEDINTAKHVTTLKLLPVEMKHSVSSPLPQSDWSESPSPPLHQRKHVGAVIDSSTSSYRFGPRDPANSSLPRSAVQQQLNTSEFVSFALPRLVYVDADAASSQTSSKQLGLTDSAMTSTLPQTTTHRLRQQFGASGDSASSTVPRTSSQDFGLRDFSTFTPPQTSVSVQQFGVSRNSPTFLSPPPPVREYGFKSSEPIHVPFMETIPGRVLYGGHWEQQQTGLAELRERADERKRSNHFLPRFTGIAKPKSLLPPNQKRRRRVFEPYYNTTKEYAASDPNIFARDGGGIIFGRRRKAKNRTRKDGDDTDTITTEVTEHEGVQEILNPITVTKQTSFTKPDVNSSLRNDRILSNLDDIKISRLLAGQDIQKHFDEGTRNNEENASYSTTVKNSVDKNLPNNRVTPVPILSTTIRPYLTKLKPQFAATTTVRPSRATKLTPGDLSTPLPISYTTRGPWYFQKLPPRLTSQRPPKTTTKPTTPGAGQTRLPNNVAYFDMNDNKNRLVNLMTTPTPWENYPRVRHSQAPPPFEFSKYNIMTEEKKNNNNGNLDKQEREHGELGRENEENITKQKTGHFGKETADFRNKENAKNLQQEGRGFGLENNGVLLPTFPFNHHTPSTLSRRPGKHVLSPSLLLPPRGGGGYSLPSPDPGPPFPPMPPFSFLLPSSTPIPPSHTSRQYSTSSPFRQTLSHFNQHSSGFSRHSESFNKRPESFMQHPASFNKRPESFTPHPASFNKRPASFTRHPESFNQRPTSFNQQHPKSFNQHPSSFSQGFNRTPKPSLIKTHKHEFNRTPKTPLNRTPKPDLNRTPRPHLNRTPRPHLNKTPKPEFIRTPKPEFNRTPKPEYIRTPQPKIIKTSKPTHIIRTPKPKTLRRTPKPELVRTPRPKFSRTPNPRYFRTTTLKPTRTQLEPQLFTTPNPIIYRTTESEHITTPGHEFLRTPGHEFLRTPKPEHTRTPRPEHTRTPKPKHTRTSRPEHTRTPRPEHTRTPRPEHTRTSRPEHTRTPRPEHTRTPRPEHTRTPRPEHTRTPRPEHTRTPRPEHTRTSRPEHTKTPNHEFFRTPNHEFLRTPRPEFTPTQNNHYDPRLHTGPHFLTPTPRPPVVVATHNNNNNNNNRDSALVQAPIITTTTTSPHHKTPRDREWYLGRYYHHHHNWPDFNTNNNNNHNNHLLTSPYSSSAFMQPRVQVDGSTGEVGEGRGVEAKNNNNNNKYLSSLGQHYPTYATIPTTSFTCKGKNTGYYADPEARCQVFHMCHQRGRRDSFLCPNGTMFHQRLLTCDHWYKVNCATTTSLYHINNNIYKTQNKKKIKTPHQVKLKKQDNPPVYTHPVRVRHIKSKGGSYSSTLPSQAVGYEDEFLLSTSGRFREQTSQPSFGQIYGREFPRTVLTSIKPSLHSSSDVGVTSPPTITSQPQTSTQVTRSNRPITNSHTTTLPATIKSRKSSPSAKKIHTATRRKQYNTPPATKSHTTTTPPPPHTLAALTRNEELLQDHSDGILEQDGINKDISSTTTTIKPPTTILTPAPIPLTLKPHVVDPFKVKPFIP
ncbi:hypothetical protein Pmani_036184 [Petrolisthes manimaculis]|uniref:Chitin-binding type-2 domain-containing protein n=1 Tax=Petrolisthes manimaculis TaxID=1843537 RepID=A0AAE1NK60_9EUCA|nr:hypothetical protein Pmani_036184 [Petrolisthes manimaculis]